MTEQTIKLITVDEQSIDHHTTDWLGKRKMVLQGQSLILRKVRCLRSNGQYYLQRYETRVQDASHLETSRPFIELVLVVPTGFEFQKYRV